MNDERRSKADLVEELAALRARLAALERDAVQQEDAEEGVDTTQRTRQELLRVGAALEGAFDAGLVIDLNRKAVYANKAFRDLFGCSPEMIGQAGLESLFVDRNIAEQIFQTILQGRHWTGEAEMLTMKDGSQFTALARGTAVLNNEGDIIDFLLLFSDVTEQKEIEERLIYEATHDALTELFNRGYLMARLGQLVHSAVRYKHPLSICLCDLDGFKAVNDTHGHAAGDDVLLRFAELIRETARADDIAGRYGGDEFCILLPHTSEQEAANCVERLRAGLQSQAFKGEGGKTFFMTASFGIARLSPEHEDEKDLLVAADRALYKAKAEGGNRIVVYAE